MRSYLALLSFVLMGVSASGQQLVSGSFSATPFPEFVNAMQASSMYRFHYDPSVMDTVKVTVSGTHQLIKYFLDEVVTGTDFRYTIDSNKVYFTLNVKIMTELAPGIFGEATPKDDNRERNLFDEEQTRRQQSDGRIYPIGKRTANMEGNAAVSGYVKDISSGEVLVGASVYRENPLIGVTADQYGYFLITLPRGRQTLIVQSLGMKTIHRQVLVYGDGRMDFEMEQEITPLKAVVVESERDQRVSGLQMGSERLDVRSVKQMPLALGEADILKAVTTLPGVQTVGEGTVGFNVRGGSSNQNLILYNDATIYNPSHLFGFFSTFNADVLKSAELNKSSITADYGGRLSSVLDITSREGNQKKFSVSGGISPVTGRLVVEGPIVKDKTSFLVGVRSTYSDWILKQLDQKRFSNSTAGFYDVNLSLHHTIDEKNSLNLSAYMSHDNFRLNSDTLYNYGDQNASLRWKHLFNNKLTGVLTGSVSKYAFSINSNSNPVNAFNLDFTIQQVNTKADFSYVLNAKHVLQGGIGSIYYKLRPGNYQPAGDQSLVVPDVMPDEQGRESSIYVGDQFEINPQLSLYAGLRYSFYQYLGPHDMYVYAQGAPKETGNIVDTVHFNAGKSIAHYGGLEPRISLRYFTSPQSSFKLGYTVTRQYIQMLSNTTAITPVDLWKLTDTYFQPQVGTQYSLGYYHNSKRKPIEFSIEVYYKQMKNLIDYKNAATFLLNRHVETDILHANGMAYGIELMIKKSVGRLNGWMNYTYSRSLLQSTGEYSDEIINSGKWYPSMFDKPHAFNLLGNYKFNRRISFSTNLTYSTGRPITLPVGIYDLQGSQRPLYSERNEYRIPDYFRIDISFNFEGNHKIRKLAHGSWTLGVYNLTGRKNAYSVYYTADGGTIKGYKLSVFAQPIPTLTYNFRF